MSLQPGRPLDPELRQRNDRLVVQGVHQLNHRDLAEQRQLDGERLPRGFDEAGEGIDCDPELQLLVLHRATCHIRETSPGAGKAMIFRYLTARPVDGGAIRCCHRAFGRASSGFHDPEIPAAWTMAPDRAF
ncbi:hypothetical protein ACRQ5Q_24150 [Bradyrhizobium sp. PMVTL-01]|uniref:hypothetical protein n=1 Tax=Bradyrhizobium sp. PMVTL-01 TaxID=3434999 RepID=UPI003F72ED6A